MNYTIIRMSALIFIAAVLLFVAIEAAFIKWNGSAVPAPSIPRQTMTYGQGKDVRLAIVGDSTAVAQGAAYDEGYAVGVARDLSKDYQVELRNFAVSGATAADVAAQQLDELQELQPDVVIVAAGANDVTHLRSKVAYQQSLQTIIDRLQKMHPNTRIILTGAPDMGSIARFPWPTRQLAGWRTTQLNKAVAEIVSAEQNVTWARIAEKTGPAFRQDPSLFAEDKFHPNARGYALWTSVLISAVRQVL